MSTSELMTKAQQGTTYVLHVGEVDILWTLDAVGKGEGGADAGRGTDPSQFVWHLPGFSTENPVSFGTLQSQANLDDFHENGRWETPSKQTSSIYFSTVVW